MAKPKKNGTYLNVCIDSAIYERLDRFSEDAGQAKTVAVERALTAYLDDYEAKQKMLQELQDTNNK
jgi:predicted DNA-binding protein